MCFRSWKARQSICVSFLQTIFRRQLFVAAVLSCSSPEPPSRQSSSLATSLPPPAAVASSSSSSAHTSTRVPSTSAAASSDAPKWFQMGNLICGICTFSYIACILFPRLCRCGWSEQKFAVVFHHSDQSDQIRMLCILFLKWDLSDQSDFAQSNATEHLDKPTHFCLFTFSLLIATWQTIREFLLICV